MGTGDSKLAIQKNVFELKEKSVLDQPAEFWEKFWTIPTSVDDFFGVRHFAASENLPHRVYRVMTSGRSGSATLRIFRLLSQR